MSSGRRRDIPEIRESSFHGHVLPGDSRRWDLGASDKYWRKAYIRDLVVGGISIEDTDWSSANSWKQYATYVVAASDSTDAGKANADFVCDGTDDHEEIAAAISITSPSGGKRVLLLEGTFYIGGSIPLESNCVIEGQGVGTVLEITASGLSVFTGDTESNIQLKNFMVDGQYSESTYSVTWISLDTVSHIRVDNVICSNSYNRFVYAVDCDIVVVNGCTFTENYKLYAVRVYNSAIHSGYFLTNNVGESSLYSYIMFLFDGDSYISGEMPEWDYYPDTGDDIRLRNILVANNSWTGSYDHDSDGYPESGAGGLVQISCGINITISNNQCDWYFGGAYLYDCLNMSISGNSFNNGYAVGIDTSFYYLSDQYGGTKAFSITGNSILHTTASYGIALEGPPHSVSDLRENDPYEIYAVVSGNFIKGGTHCFLLDLAANFVISNNFLFGNLNSSGVPYTYGIEALEFWECLITGNFFYRCDTGAYLAGASYSNLITSVLIGNYFLSSSAGDILLDGCDWMFISSNYFMESVTISSAFDRQSINLWDCDNTVIQGNMFVSGGVVTTYADYAIKIKSDCNNIVIRENDFRGFDAGTSIISDSGTGTLFVGQNLTPDGVLDDLASNSEAFAFMMA